MKKILFYILVASIFFAACNKDSINTKPTLTLKSVSTDVVPLNGTLQIDFSFTDKESDIDSCYIFRTRLNKKKALVTLRDTLKFKVPSYDVNKTGNFTIDFNSYQNYLISAQTPPTSGTPPKNEADTMLYKFVVKDAAKNISDTVTYSTIVILR